MSAVSVGILDGEPRLDLNYDEDVVAETDMNIVCTGDGRFVEVQGTAEREPFDRKLLDGLLALAWQAATNWPASSARPGPQAPGTAAPGA